MFRLLSRSRSTTRRVFVYSRPLIVLVSIVLLSLLLAACSGSSSDNPPANGNGTATTTTTGGGGGTPSFPTTPPPLRTPTFSAGEQIAPTVTVLSSVEPSLIVQFPLQPASIKKLFPDATGVVTVVQGNPAISVFDTVTVDVQHMPPNVKFTVFFTELSSKPFGHAEYVGDVITEADGSGESVFHLITFVAFAADNRNAGASADQSGSASGIQLEHVGMWFDGNTTAEQVLHMGLGGTPFDGGFTPLHGGPQAMTDGQTLPVI